MPGTVYQELVSQFRTDMREKLTIVRTHLEDATRRDAPVLSGDLRDSIVMEDFHESFSSFTATITATAPQAVYTELGTGEFAGRGRIYPHPPNRALAFYWYRIGKYMIVASVAGQPPQYWWDGPNGDRFEQRLDDAVAAAFGS